MKIRGELGNEAWLNEILSSNAFQDYEGTSLDILQRYGDETGFVAQYFRDGRIEMSEHTRGDSDSVQGAFPHGADMVAHVHYHPGRGNVAPSRKDIYGSDQDTMLLQGELGVLPVHMIGAPTDDGAIYSARQRTTPAGRVEKFLFSHSSPRAWKPLKYMKFEMDWKRQLATQMIINVGEDAEREMRGMDFDDALRQGRVSYRRFGDMVVDSLENVFNYRTGLVESTGDDGD
jgi:hypothetical protein